MKTILSEINSCIIDKQGNIYPCEYHEHISACLYYFNKRQEELEKKGYLFISAMCLVFGGYYYNEEITDKQIEACEKLYEAHNRNLWDKQDLNYKDNAPYLDCYLEFK
jgi:hypothetical protein